MPPKLRLFGGDRRPTRFPVSVNPRKYQWSFKFYPDSTDYDYKELISLLQRYFYEWAWVLHDKDKLEFKRERLRVCSLDRTRKTGAFRSTHRKLFVPFGKPHIHFFGRNNSHSNVSKQSLVKYLSLPYSYNHRPHDIEPICDWSAMLQYTVHRNHPDKYQYDIKRVHTNVIGFVDIINQKPTVNDEVRILYNILDEARIMGITIPYYKLVQEMTAKGCKIQFSRYRMVKEISESYQYYEMGTEVR